jgi:hypothetical protein
MFTALAEMFRGGSVKTKESEYNLRLAETLAAFANLKEQDAAAFRAGVRRRANAANVIQHFLPDACWTLPQLAPSSDSPSSIKEFKYAWQEIQSLVRNVWDEKFPMSLHDVSYQIATKLDLYSRIPLLAERLNKELLRIYSYQQERKAIFDKLTEDNAAFIFDTLLSGALEYGTVHAVPEVAGLVLKLGQTWEWTPGTPTPEGYILASIDWLTVSAPKTSPCWHAVEFLVFNSWRAKVCRECGRRYVALKQQSRYCTTECSVPHRRKANKKTGNNWWREHGREWRRRRRLAQRQGNKALR